MDTSSVAEQKATHTPGPWEVVRHTHIDDELWLSVNQHADEHGMKEWIAEIKYLATDTERQLANARLIAAAPDLYAAMNDAKEYLDETFGPCDPDCECLLHSFHAALAKAEGKTT